jgi:hypothetical protein
VPQEVIDESKDKRKINSFSDCLWRTWHRIDNNLWIINLLGHQMWFNAGQGGAAKFIQKDF